MAARKIFPLLYNGHFFSELGGLRRNKFSLYITTDTFSALVRESFKKVPLLYNGHLLLETQVSIEKKFCPLLYNCAFLPLLGGWIKKSLYYTTDIFEPIFKYRGRKNRPGF